MFSFIVIAVVVGSVVGWVMRGVVQWRKQLRTPPLPPPPPKPSPQQLKLMGMVVPGDQRIPVPVRDWSAMKIALWRSKTAWEIATREATDVIGRCAHMQGCAGKEVETEPCLPDCPDRELRMSALVILNAARQFAPYDARRPANEPFHAPSRERYSEVLAELAAVQAELEALRATGASVPPPPNTNPELPEQPKEPIPINVMAPPDEDEMEEAT